MPALTISISIGPLAARASSKARSIASRSVTSHWMAVPPDDRRDSLKRLAAAARATRPSRPPRARCVGGGGADAGSAAGDQRMAPSKPVCSAIASPFDFSIGRTRMTVARRRETMGDRLMKTRAAVAFEAKKPLEIVELDLEGPKAGEVLVEIMATGICHTDAYTLDGFDSEGIFPSILGHEGAGIVREVGPGVTSVKPGDHVIPLYTPECRQCKSCLCGKTNLCTAIRATQGKGADARRHQPLQLQGPDHLSLYGLLDLFELHRAARDRGREDPRGRAVQDQLLHRLRRHHRRRRGGQDRQGRAGRERRRVRPRRHRPQRHPGRQAGRREQDRRRRHQPGPRGMGPQVRHDRLPQHRGHGRARTSSRRSSR